MRLVLFSSLLGLIATSLLEEYFESSSDEDNFDIDAYYTVFGNDTPEKGDLRYKPSELDPEKRSEAVDKSVGDSTVDKINDITDGVAQEMKNLWGWFTDAIGDIKSDTEDALNEAQTAAKAFFDNAGNWNNDQWNAQLQKLFTNDKELVVLKSVCQGIDNGSANLTSIEDVKKRDLLDQHCRALKATAKSAAIAGTKMLTVLTVSFLPFFL
ncbi:unnamed protein product [Oikopleura dioica]|uniref:Secreted protein n=1 Tax=Oikopleura dioica TaxID=34765 RepID=E4YFE1_OIKDI|nr:unnamed protein product [Oikopleura dioica]